MSCIYYARPSITDLEVRYASHAARHGWGDRCHDYIHRFEESLPSTWASSTRSRPPAVPAPCTWDWQRSHQHGSGSAPPSVCRFCGAPLFTSFADLGLSPLANSFVEARDLTRVNGSIRCTLGLVAATPSRYSPAA